MAEEQGSVLGPKAVEQIAKTVRENSRRIKNETPQRGRWQQRVGGAIELSHGVILEVCSPGCSTYRVQRVHRYLSPECDDESGSGS